MNNPKPVSQEPIELVGVKETIAEGAWLRGVYNNWIKP